MMSDIFKKVIPFESITLSPSPSRDNLMTEEIFKKSQEAASGVVLGEIREQTEKERHINSLMWGK